MQKFQRVQEGISTIFLPITGEVFYNPVQEFNRDLSVLVVSRFQEIFKPKQRERQGIRILDALTASGFRAVRYACQIPKVEKIVANDLDAGVIPTITKNLQANNIPEGLVSINIANANSYLYSKIDDEREKFDVIDLDPYGTAVPFLDASIQGLSDGGLLCVTCTDKAVLCGVHPDTCFSKYGSIPSHSPYCHEFAVRILLSALETTASKYQRYIEPLVSASIDFYVRVFVRVHKSPIKAKKSIMRKSLTYVCASCRSFKLHPLGEFKESTSKICLPHSKISQSCSICGGNLQITGPIWNGELCKKEFVTDLLAILEEKKLLLNTNQRLTGLLSLLNEEVNTPLYMSLPHMTKLLHVTAPPLETFKSAFLNENYFVSISHCDPLGIKTTAPMEFVWDVMRKWASLNSIKSEHMNDPLISNILSKKPQKDVDLSLHPNAKPERGKKLLRFQVNPENWGPKPRAKKHHKLDTNDLSSQ